MYVADASSLLCLSLIVCIINMLLQFFWVSSISLKVLLTLECHSTKPSRLISEPIGRCPTIIWHSFKCPIVLTVSYCSYLWCQSLHWPPILHAKEKFVSMFGVSLMIKNLGYKTKGHYPSAPFCLSTLSDFDVPNCLSIGKSKNMIQWYSHFGCSWLKLLKSMSKNLLHSLHLAKLAATQSPPKKFLHF